MTWTVIFSSSLFNFLLVISKCVTHRQLDKQPKSLKIRLKISINECQKETFSLSSSLNNKIEWKFAKKNWFALHWIFCCDWLYHHHHPHKHHQNLPVTKSRFYWFSDCAVEVRNLYIFHCHSTAAAYSVRFFCLLHIITLCLLVCVCVHFFLHIFPWSVLFFWFYC